MHLFSGAVFGSAKRQFRRAGESKTGKHCPKTVYLAVNDNIPALCRVPDYAEWLRAIDSGVGIGRGGYSAELEGGQERQKCIVGFEAGQATPDWGQFPKCLLFHPEVSLNVTMGRFQTFVSEPKRDNSISTPDWRRCIAVEWRLCLQRHSRIMPSSA